MNPVAPIDCFVSLDNIFAFKTLCHRKSMGAFEASIDKKQYPSRFNCLVFGLLDCLTAPFYAARKIYEFALNMWNLLSLKGMEGPFLPLDQVSATLRLVTFQLTIPILCTVIRITASLTGVLIPKFALKGWRLAEAGEEYSLILWDSHFHDASLDDSYREHGEEILPANAIYYLGLEDVRQIFMPDPDLLKRIEKEIHAHFSDLLNHILDSNSDCFQILLRYEQAVKCPSLLQKDRRSYKLSCTTQAVLKQLQEMKPVEEGLLVEADSPGQEEPDKLLIDAIFTGLKIEQLELLFHHIYINLEDPSLCHELNLDINLKDQFFTKLLDLFSLRLRFGRAHYQRSCSELHDIVRV